MIKGLTIAGFKRFVRQDIELAPLTILAGVNGSGKTSAIQALLLAREANYSIGVVPLNGPSGLRLGSSLDVRNWTTIDSMEVAATSEAGEVFSWYFGFPSDDSLYLTVEDQTKRGQPLFRRSAWEFSYLEAEREGPRTIQPFSAASVAELEIGSRGEYCAQVLNVLGDKPLEDASREHPEKKGDGGLLLKYQVEKWLNEIARPVEIAVHRLPGSSVAILRYRPTGGEWVMSTNMGFGVTYSLPIIVAGLICRSGGLLIVENPEAHLHPRGQSKMGVFLAWLAGRGVQVIVETHSDHILNGVRRAIGEHKYLEHKNALVNYFSDGSEGGCVVDQLRFSARGGVSEWPRGFFDQYQIDVSALGKVRRGA